MFGTVSPAIGTPSPPESFFFCSQASQQKKHPWNLRLRPRLMVWEKLCLTPTRNGYLFLVSSVDFRDVRFFSPFFWLAIFRALCRWTFASTCQVANVALWTLDGRRRDVGERKPLCFNAWRMLVVTYRLLNGLLNVWMVRKLGAGWYDLWTKTGVVIFLINRCVRPPYV